MNRNFSYFDNWVITHTDGRSIKRAERNIIADNGELLILPSKAMDLSSFIDTC